MKLSVNQIKNITFGAVRSEQREDGLHFFKCTESQVAAWYALAKELGERSETTTGIRLDFHTNSTSFTFEADGIFEVYVNDLYREKLDMSSLGGKATVKLCDPLGDALDDVRVTLIFPSHDKAGVLRSVELDDGSYVKPHVFDRKILFIGDSITQGWDSGYDSLSYAWRVTRFFNAESVIHGVGGGYFHVSTIDHIDFDPDIVIIALGTNDFGRNPSADELREKASAFMDKIADEYRGKKIFYISPLWRAVQEKPMGKFSLCRQTCIDEANKHGFIHVIGLDLVPPSPVFDADEVPHPNALGVGIYAENLIRELQKHI